MRYSMIMGILDLHGPFGYPYMLGLGKCEKHKVH
jgi:hypothetical protein